MRKLLGIVVLCAVAASAIAVPARRGGVVRTAADGTEKTVFLNGDEFFHYITDADGNWLDEETLLPMTEEAVSEKLKFQEKAEAKRAKVRRAKTETGLDRLLSPRGAVILVSYADKAFSSSHDAMVEWAMGENYTYNGATGSIHQYFWDQSWGQYDLQIDVYGPVTVSKGYAYYGKDSGGEGNDQHADELIVEACKIAHDSLGADFSQYDWDNDGNVDWVVVIYAGKGQADGGASNTIWPHQYDLSYTGMSFKLDGKWVDHYCCLNEIDGSSGKRCGIGTFCHEFSHVMGLPDFYATTEGSTHRTLGSWDIMDYGPYNNDGNTPPSYSAYERWFMGWIEPTLLNTAATVTLANLNHEGGRACYITENGNAISNILRPSPSTFYMLENRQKSGWDQYIKGSGLMITKVQWSRSKWENNTVNNTASAMGVDIIEAKKNTSSYTDKTTDLYPRGATSFTQVTNYQVTDIAMADSIITFNVNGGGSEINLAIPTVTEQGQSIKILRDGKLFIIRNGVTYDITGRRL
ncbi:MAG: M6 family metalloprotease domain-containing protein [Paludibacteraceae bacterium]|nr:M6 family metalloprotease domain-containing protein [Paludibacteraceae bacterium]